MEQPVWFCKSRSVIGPTHVSKNKPNQDAHRELVDSDIGFAILSVADGHGSELCSHSEVGSQLAVQVATELLSSTVKQLLERFDFKGPWIKDIRLNSTVASLKTDLPVELVAAWRSKVDEQRARLNAEAKPGYLAFGTTLLAIAVTQTSPLFSRSAMEI